MVETFGLLAILALLVALWVGLFLLWLRATRRARRPPEVVGDPSEPVRYSYFGHIVSLIRSSPDAGAARTTPPRDERAGDT